MTKNSNGKLDRNFMGSPKEGVGASNDAKGSFGPPKFADARFTFKGPDHPHPIPSSPALIAPTDPLNSGKRANFPILFGRAAAFSLFPMKDLLAIGYRIANSLLR
jgi:hypothetical protein